MTYTVKEIFKTLQGEGAQAGRAAVFCRFAGCNLWTGREEDRSGAVCQFCDTDFVGGERYSAEALADAIENVWGTCKDHRFVVFTGGEPFLQLDELLLAFMHNRDFETAVETNGTLDPKGGVDWLCVSPKARAPLRLFGGDELKVVYPQAGQDLTKLGKMKFRHFWIQPMDGPDIEGNTQAAIHFCLENPQWRLSLQTHKILGLR